MSTRNRPPDGHTGERAAAVDDRTRSVGLAHNRVHKRHPGAGRDPRQASARVFSWAASIFATCAIALLTISTDTSAQTAPKLGTPIAPADLAKWDLTIFPDGRGLPPGRGTPTEGRAIYDAQCATCHGEGGRGATAEELVSEPQPLNVEGASKAIGPYWPYATTIFDFIRRSMPAHAPGSLTSDEVYAVTAYLLAANKIIAENDVIDASTLPKVKMPNRDGFDWIDVKK